MKVNIRELTLGMCIRVHDDGGHIIKFQRLIGWYKCVRISGVCRAARDVLGSDDYEAATIPAVKARTVP